MEPQVPQPAAKPASSGCGKWAIGCAIGCGALIALVVIAAGVGSWWMVRPGKQHATTAVVSPQASGSFAVGDLGGDPGVTALLDNFMRETQRQQNRNAPDWVRQMQQMSAASGSPSTGLRMFLPRQATVSLEPSTEGRDGPAVVAAINPRGFTRMLHFILARGDTLVGEHRDYDVLKLSSNAWGSLVGGTLLVSNEEQALHRGIDRFLDGAAAAAPPPVNLGLPERPWDLTGSIDQRDEGFARFLWGDEEEPPIGVQRAALGVDVATSDRTTGRVALDCESAEAAAAALVALDRRVAERAQRLAEKGMQLRAASRAEGSRAVVDWEVTGVDTAVATWVASEHDSSGAYDAPSDVDEPSDSDESGASAESSDAH